MKAKVYSLCVWLNLVGTIVLCFCWLLWPANLLDELHPLIGVFLPVVGFSAYLMAAFILEGEWVDRNIDYGQRNVINHFWKMTVLSLTPTLTLSVNLAIGWITPPGIPVAIFSAGAVLAIMASLWAENIIAQT